MLHIHTIVKHTLCFLQGAPNCLEGLTFVISGVLDSIERDQAAEIIKKYGGRVTSAVSKKTDYLVSFYLLNVQCSFSFLLTSHIFSLIQRLAWVTGYSSILHDQSTYFFLFKFLIFSCRCYKNW